MRAYDNLQEPFEKNRWFHQMSSYNSSRIPSETSQHSHRSQRKPNLQSGVLKHIKQIDSPLVWSLASDFSHSGTPIPSYTSHFSWVPLSLYLPRDAAPNAPRLILPSGGYELKGWHCGHGRHAGDLSWPCSNLWVCPSNESSFVFLDFFLDAQF